MFYIQRRVLVVTHKVETCTKALHQSTDIKVFCYLFCLYAHAMFTKHYPHTKQGNLDLIYNSDKVSLFSYVLELLSAKSAPNVIFKVRAKT